MLVRNLIGAALFALAAGAGAADLSSPQPDAAWLARVMRVEQSGGLSCGPPPPAPPGCRLGPCVCDASGNSCAWQFVCR